MAAIQVCRVGEVQDQDHLLRYTTQREVIMNTVDFLDPGFFEYLLLVIGVSLIIFVFFMGGVVVHIQHGKLVSIADKVLERGPFMDAEEYGLTPDQIQCKIEP
jgi:uncharacterized membrane protein